MRQKVTRDEIPDWFAVKLMSRRIEVPKVAELGPCWVTGLRPANKDGYVRVNVPTGSAKGRRNVAIHQLSYVIAGGVLDPELEIQHKCHFRPCYRPEHLEQGTHHQNMQSVNYNAWIRPKRSHCKNGHALTGDNVMYSKGGTVRRCRTCRSAKMKIYKRTYRKKVG